MGLISPDHRLELAGMALVPLNLYLGTPNNGFTPVKKHPIQLGGVLIQCLHLGFEPDLINHAQDLSFG